MRRQVCYLLISGLIFLSVLSGGYMQEANAEPKMIKRVIRIEAERSILHYQKESFWDKENFYKILNSKDEFENKELNSFKKEIQRYGRSIVEPKIEFNKSTNSTVLNCDIKGTKEGTWFDFDWFLRPLGLDFLDSHFERRKKELYWEGEVGGRKTIISIKFPFPISNCHEHVWRR